MYSRRLAPLNIKFTTSHTLYDYAINSIDDDLINCLPYYFDDSCLDTSLLLINNPVDIINRESEFNNLIMNKLLFFHDDKLLQMKKEDLFLFKKQIQKYSKFTFDDKVSQIIDDVIPIKYGFKVSDYSMNTNRKKSVIFLGNKQNIDAMAYNHIKKSYEDADFYTSDIISKMDPGIMLSNYKICISMNSLYNNLLAASAGCYVISSINCNDIPFYTKVTNFSEVLSGIQKLLSNYDTSHHKHISEEISKKYDYTTYSNSIKKIIYNECNGIINL